MVYFNRKTKSWSDKEPKQITPEKLKQIVGKGIPMVLTRGYIRIDKDLTAKEKQDIGALEE